MKLERIKQKIKMKLDIIKQNLKYYGRSEIQEKEQYFRLHKTLIR